MCFNRRFIVCRQTIKDIAWNVTSDAQFILAIAFTDRVAIYGQKRAAGVRSEVEWVCYTEFKVDT
jgi:hypothetical protein